MKAFNKLTHEVDGERRIISDPPLIVPIGEMVEADRRDEITAGNRPEKTAAASVASTVKSSAGPSTSNVIHDGGGFSRLRTVADSQSVDA